jgi:hypothetical protein
MRSESDWTIQRASCHLARVHTLGQRYWLVLAAVWLQVTVIAFVILETNSRVMTPVTDWMNKIVYLLGM